MILEDVRGIIDPHLGEIVFGKPFVNVSNMIYDKDECIVTFSNETRCVKYMMPHKFEKFKGIENLDVDNIPTIEVSRGDKESNKINYSGWLALGSEYKWDNEAIRRFKTAFRLWFGKT